MDVNLIVGILAFVFLIAFFVDNLKAVAVLKSGSPFKANPIQRAVWKLTGNEERFLFVFFLIEIVLLIVGGWFANGFRYSAPIRVSFWGGIYFGVLAAASIYDTFRLKK